MIQIHTNLQGNLAFADVIFIIIIFYFFGLHLQQVQGEAEDLGGL